MQQEKCGGGPRDLFSHGSHASNLIGRVAETGQRFGQDFKGADREKLFNGLRRILEAPALLFRRVADSVGIQFEDAVNEFVGCCASIPCDRSDFSGKCLRLQVTMTSALPRMAAANT